MDHDKEKPKKKRGRKPKKDKPTISKILITEESNEEVKEEDIDGYDSSFSIKTVQSGAMSNFFMSLKKYCEIITLNITSEGITIVEPSPSFGGPVLIHSSLYHQNFEEYTVDKDIKLHINLDTFYNIIRYVKNNDDLTFQKNKSENFWSFIVYNSDNNTRNKYGINLIEREHVDLAIPPAYFDYEFNLSSVDYKDLFKKTKHIKADKIRIEAKDYSLKFICKNPEVSGEIEFSGAECLAASGQAEGEFPYKEMALSTHFTNVCNIFRIYIKNDYPLVIKCDVSMLGDIKLCFAPIITE